jgi:hypothetical protein
MASDSVAPGAEIVEEFGELPKDRPKLKSSDSPDAGLK